MILLPIISLGFLILFLMGALISFQYFTHYQNLANSERTHIVDQRQRARTALGFMVAFSFAAFIALSGLIVPALLGYTPDPVQPFETPPTLPGISPTFSTSESATNTSPVDSSPTSQPEPTVELTPTRILPTATIGNTGGAGANIRSSPGLGGTIIETLADGTRVILLGDIQQVDNFEWQSIEMPDTREGWVVTRFLIPEN